MTSGRGATMTWTSFNYPATITNGADNSAFSYTPDREYWKQVSNYTSGGTATTLYLGSLLEKVTTSSGSDYRHMIRAGNTTIIVSRTTAGVNTVNYVTSDHLGSSSAITNSAGGILVNSSFDAYGKRRGANWSGNPNAGDWNAIAATTRLGFTEHTMLDNLNLAHMNGRVYDQVLGRFLSADPFITEAMNTQNLNRYSYVYNNPLSGIDPSGFEALQEIVVSHTVTQDPATFMNWTDFSGGSSISGTSPLADRGSADGLSDNSTDGSEPPMEEVVVTAPRFNPRRAVMGTIGLRWGSFVPLYDLLDCVYGKESCSRGKWFLAGISIIPGVGTETRVAEETISLAKAGLALEKGVAGTLKGLGKTGSHGIVDAGTALSAGQKWLGAGYKEIAPGVFRSADGLRQFRMTNADILGAHGSMGSHVHFEALNGLGKVVENLHLGVTP